VPDFPCTSRQTWHRLLDRHLSLYVKEKSGFGEGSHLGPPSLPQFKPGDKPALRRPSYSTRCGYSCSSIARYRAYTGLVIGISARAFFTLPAVLMRRRAMAIAMFSLPWK
jgi:hypothetical protein